MKNTRIVAWLVLALGVAQVVLSGLLFTSGDEMQFASQTNAGFVDPMIVPAGYAFSIWGVIYAGMIAYGVYQLLATQRKRKVHAGVRLPVISSLLAVCAWLLAARFDLVLVTLVCMGWLLGSVVTALVRAAKQAKTAQDRYLMVWPIGLFAGWVTVASAANVAAVLAAYGVQWFAGAEVAWTITLLLLASAGAFVVVRKSAGVWTYTAAVVWGLVAVAVANQLAVGFNAIGATAAVAAIVLALLTERYWCKS